MGATLETMRVKATTAKEAAVKIIGSGNGNDPYSGWFDTCHEFVDKTFKLKESEFEDWVFRERRKTCSLRDERYANRVCGLGVVCLLN